MQVNNLQSISEISQIRRGNGGLIVKTKQGSPHDLYWTVLLYTGGVVLLADTSIQTLMCFRTRSASERVMEAL